MWETVATSRRQDRALHGAAKLLNLLVGLFALPAWLLGQWLGGPVRRRLARGEEEPQLPVPAPAERSMASLIPALEALPSRLRSTPWAEPRKGLRDLSTFVLTQHHDAAALGYSYPRPFSEHLFDGADGLRIGASLGLHEQPRPALIVAHGLFSTRRFDYVREIAVRAFYEWGFNVAAVDLRGFGLTGLMNDAPSSGGWKEGEDLIRVAEQLRDLGATSVGALGISLGGSSVLAASHPRGAEALAGGILAISPPADVGHATDRLSRRVPLRHPAYAINLAFRAMLLSRVRGSRWPDDVRHLDQALEQVSATYYGLDSAEIRARSSAANHIAGARVPVLVLHPVDDQIIPIRHAELLRERSARNDLVHVWTLPGGGHGAIDAVDERWAYSVYRGFFERWASYPDRGEAEVVYSPPPNGKVEVGG